MPQASLPWAGMDDRSRTEFWATLALRHAQGVGPRSCARLLQTFGSAYTAMQHMGQWAEAGISAEKKAQVQSGSWRVTARREWDDAQGIDAHILLWHDPLYPPLLKQLPDAPPLLYYKGDISLLKAPAVAIVGSRQCTDDGIKVAATIAGQLSACGITIVSGMALGIDSVAHRRALRGVGKSIAVLGTGIDVIYPQANTYTYGALSAQGLVLSEFAPHMRAGPTNFPVRNRIISGLSLGVLVVEAAVRSGSLITARLALEQNREVYAIPGPVFSKQSEGCQALIRQGARVIFSAEDIVRDLADRLEDYGIHKAASIVQELGPHVPLEDIAEGDDPTENALREEAAKASRLARGQQQKNTTRAAQPPAGEKTVAGHGNDQKNGQKVGHSASPQPAIATGQGLQHGGTIATITDLAVAQGAGGRSGPPPAPLQGDAERIFAYVQMNGKVHVDSLCTALELPVENVSSLLIELEINKYLLRQPGAWYCVHGDV